MEGVDQHDAGNTRSQHHYHRHRVRAYHGLVGQEVRGRQVDGEVQQGGDDGVGQNFAGQREERIAFLLLRLLLRFVVVVWGGMREP